jgi:hypothetical protein
MIFQVLLENDPAVEFSRSSTGDCRALAIAKLYYPSHASSSVFGLDLDDSRMFGEEAFTLGERRRVRFHGLDSCKFGPRAANQILPNPENYFFDHGQRGYLNQINGRVNRSDKTVLDGRENVVCHAIVGASEKLGEGFAGHQLNVSSEQLDSCLFAERSVLALKSHSRPVA